MHYYVCRAGGCTFGCEKHENKEALEHVTRFPAHHLNEGGGKYINCGDDFVCRDCGSDIMGARVAHPIHDGPFPLSGSGRCEYETVPYCPECDDKPNFHGSPIIVPFSL